ncbi:hypothetical protein AB0903_31630 [Streptomyces sp. NPDC048389]|uniref:hypothetical protein n=1 Tax=Streptomyces sp. NPDC048389 TaxID=3154622 RepID=UPI00345166B1
MSDQGQRECAYCPEPGADVCVRQHGSASGSGLSVYAHRGCAEERRVPVLYALLGTMRAEHFA